MDLDDFRKSDTIRDTPNTSERAASCSLPWVWPRRRWNSACIGTNRNARRRRKEATMRKEPNGIPREELLRYLEGAAKGLDFLNVDHNIQHGDVKPANIMIISGEGQVSDFDLANTLGRHAHPRPLEWARWPTWRRRYLTRAYPSRVQRSICSCDHLLRTAHRQAALCQGYRFGRRPRQSHRPT